MHQPEQDDRAAKLTMATAGMVGRWKGRALKLSQLPSKFVQSNDSFTRKKRTEAESSYIPHDADSGRPLVHGAVRFPGSRKRPAKWARVSHEATMSDVMQLVTRTWGLTAPSALISIVGSRDSTFDRECRQVFAGPGLKRAAAPMPG